MTKTALGLDKNVSAMLCYALGWVSILTQCRVTIDQCY